MFDNLTSQRRNVTALAVALPLLLASCGSDATVEDATEEAAGETGEQTTSLTTVITDREVEVGPAVERMFAFIDTNPDVCSAEFESFNVPYPEDPEDPQVAELDAGIEDRGDTLTGCLTDAGEIELSEDISLLTLWGRHLADQDR